MVQSKANKASVSRDYEKSPFRENNVVSLTSYQKGIYRGVDVTRMEKLLDSIKKL